MTDLFGGRFVPPQPFGRWQFLDLFRVGSSVGAMLPNKSLEPTGVGAFSSAVAVLVFWSRVAQLGR